MYFDFLKIVFLMTVPNCWISKNGIGLGYNGDVVEEKWMLVPQLVLCDLCIHVYIV